MQAALIAKDQLAVNLKGKITAKDWEKLKANNQHLKELYQKAEAEIPNDMINREVQKKAIAGLKQRWAKTDDGIINFEKNYELNDQGFYVAKQRR